LRKVVTIWKNLKIYCQKREAIDTFAFAQSFIVKGGDVERRFALIALDNSLELVLEM